MTSRKWIARLDRERPVATTRSRKVHRRPGSACTALSIRGGGQIGEIAHPVASMKRRSVEVADAAPCRARSARSSSNVRSHVCSSAARITGACASTRPERLSPPYDSGCTDPFRRARDSWRVALKTLNLNRSAASRRLMPPSIAATTHSSRSTDIGVPTSAGLVTSRHNESGSRLPVMPARVTPVGTCSTS